MHLQEFLLLQQVKMGEFFHQLPMGPTIRIETLKLVVARQAQHAANRDMHKVLLFFLRESLWTLTQLLNSDNKKHSI